jgi:hypothetical protein
MTGPNKIRNHINQVERNVWYTNQVKNQTGGSSGKSNESKSGSSDYWWIIGGIIFIMYIILEGKG